MTKILHAIIFVFSAWNLTYAQGTETRKAADFKGLKVSRGVDVVLQKGNSESVKVVTSEIPLSDVVTSVRNNILKITIDSSVRKVKGKVEVFVTYKDLDVFWVSSGASITSNDIITSERLELSASSAGDIHLKVKSNEIDIEASSAGSIDLEGSATKVSLNVSSGAEVKAFNLEADEVRTHASSGSNVHITANREISAQASSGGSIRYKGTPDHTVSRATSGGFVKHLKD